MKLQNIFKSLVLGLALLLATGVFAATNKGSIQLFDTVSISGTQLGAGEYSVKWDGKGPDVQLNILKGNKVVATTQARLIDLDDKPASDAALVTNNADGSKALTQIRFGGKKYALAIGSESTSTESAGSSK